MQILCVVLGEKWPVERLHYWFQHRSQNKASKYSGSEVKDEDKELWNKVEKIWTMSSCEKLAVNISQCKLRAVHYLESYKDKWVNTNFDFKRKQSNTLHNLKLAYNNGYHGDTDTEVIEHLFDVELPSLPAVGSIYDIQKSSEQSKNY